MREMKFRVWNDRLKEWHYFEIPSIMDHPQADHKINYIHWCQHTGLKDCNGKEIYEGDILGHGMSNKKRDVLVVSWDKPDAMFIITDQYEMTDQAWRWGEVSSVIGNIYENPELLKR